MAKKMKRKREYSSKKPASKKKRTGDYQKGREFAKPHVELKAFDVAYTATAIPTAGVVIDYLNCPINGAELYQRVGRKTYMKSVHLRGWIVNTATAVQDIVRLIVFYDSQANAAPPTVVNLIQDSNAAGATTVLSEINLTNRQRFKILRDKQIMLPSVTNAAGVLTNQAFQETDHFNSVNINEFIKLKGLETIFNGTNGGTAADITSGALGFMIISGANNGLWTFDWQSRLRYYD